MLDAQLQSQLQFQLQQRACGRHFPSAGVKLVGAIQMGGPSAQRRLQVEREREVEGQPPLRVRVAGASFTLNARRCGAQMNGPATAFECLLSAEGRHWGGLVAGGLLLARFWVAAGLLLAAWPPATQRQPSGGGG